MWRFCVLFLLVSLSMACAPQKECAEDSVCAKGQICTKGVCIPGCRQTEGCPTPQKCINQQCVAEITCKPGNSRLCFEGKDEHRGVGGCKAGIQLCKKDSTWTSCFLQVLPQKEICDFVDNDCNGTIDDVSQGGCECQLGEKRECYNGPQNTLGVGPCKKGVQHCEKGNRWGQCSGQRRPLPETCNGIDDDCNGKIDDWSECQCQSGTQQGCYSGPARTASHKPCKQGKQLCGPNSKWGTCADEVLPKAGEECNGVDDDCDGTIDVLPGTQTPLFQLCYGGDKGCVKADKGYQCKGPCLSGLRFCKGGTFEGQKCEGQVLPTAEKCNGLDDDCDGDIDEDVKRDCYSGDDATKGKGSCKAGSQTCAAGVWGPCKGEVLPKAEECNGIDDDCDGQVDNVKGQKQALQRQCYEPGSPGCLPDGKGGFTCKGACAAGSQSCSNGKWDFCSQATLPKKEECNDKDDDCDGAVDEDVTRPCYSGKAGCLLESTGYACKGLCQAGSQTCKAGKWEACTGEVLPKTQETCDGKDEDCDGAIDNGISCTCTPGAKEACFSGAIGCTKSGQGFLCKGTCAAGTRTCQSDRTWSPCVGEVLPRPELCDNLDNNCDGQKDENFPVGNACTSGQAGCQRSGKFLCAADGKGTRCDAVPGTPSKEICDGKDNDCNGKIDDGLTAPPCSKQQGVCRGAVQVCGPTSWIKCTDLDYQKYSADYQLTETTCDGKDNDCNGKIDDIAPASLPLCAMQKGVCQGAKARCANGAIQPCTQSDYSTHDPSYETKESTCDGKDNDCDGNIDDGLTPPACSKTTGLCQGAVQTCKGASGWADCTTADYLKLSADYEAIESLCDGKDNDCNGKIDDIAPANLPSCPVAQGVCQGAKARCANGAIQPCAQSDYSAHDPSFEIFETRCDGKDNDCNGQIDENYAEKGKVCRDFSKKGACQVGTYTCSGGQLSCPTSVTPKAEICGDGVDNDCDGLIDEADAGCACYPNALTHAFQAHSGAVRGLAFDPKSDILATGGAGNNPRLRLYNRKTGLSTRDIHTAKDVNAVAIDNNGNFLYAATDDSSAEPVLKVDLKSSATPTKYAATVTGGGSSIALTANGATLAVGEKSGTRIHLWDTATGTHSGSARTGDHSNHVTALSFHPSTNALASGDKSGVIKEWSLGAGLALSFVKNILTLTAIQDLAFSNSGNYLAAVEASTTQARILKNGARDQDANYTNRLSAVAWDPTRQLVAMGGGSTSVTYPVREVRVWDTQKGTKGEFVSTFAGPLNLIQSVAWSADGSTLAAGTLTGKVFIWSCTARCIPHKLSKTLSSAFFPQPIQRMAWGPLSKTLAEIRAGSDDVRVWDLPLNRVVQTYQGPSGGATPRDLRFDPRRPGLAVAYSDGILRTWDLNTPTNPPRTHSRASNHQPFHRLAISRNSFYLLALGGPGSYGANWWDYQGSASSAAAVGIFSNSQSAGLSFALAEDPPLAIIGFQNGQVSLYCIPTNSKCIPSISGAKNSASARNAHSQGVNSAQADPQGRYFVTGSEDGNIKIWDRNTFYDTSTPLVTKATGAPVVAMSLSSTGVLATWSRLQKAVKLWRMPDGAQIGEIAGLSGNNSHLAWSPDGQQLAIANGKDILLYTCGP